MGLSIAVIAHPKRENGLLHKGALIVNECDRLCRAIPHLKEYFYLVERRGWLWMNKEKSADIKLVDDTTTLEETRRKFQNAIVLKFANGDFVNTDIFRPLGAPKPYTGIQIAAWQKFKRHSLFVEAAALLPEKKFLKFGHFWQRLGWFGWNLEVARRREIIRLGRKLRANIDFPDKYVSDPQALNKIINTAKMGILTSECEGLNRFKMECLSANIPMLVAEDSGPATTRHINERTGLLFKPTAEDLAKAIRYVEEHIADFSPRAYVLENTGIHNALSALKEALRTLARRDGFERSYNEVYWDGRNENLTWGEKQAIAEVRNIIMKCGC